MIPRTTARRSRSTNFTGIHESPNIHLNPVQTYLQVIVRAHAAPCAVSRPLRIFQFVQ